MNQLFGLQHRSRTDPMILPAFLRDDEVFRHSQADVKGG